MAAPVVADRYFSIKNGDPANNVAIVLNTDGTSAIGIGTDTPQYALDIPNGSARIGQTTFGAPGTTPNNSAVDNAAAIQAILTAAGGTWSYTLSGQVTVDLGSSVLYIGSPIYVPSGVTVIGHVRNMATFPINTPSVYIGLNDGTATFNARLRNFKVDCNSVTGSIGVYSNSLNEQCGGNQVFIVRYMNTGLSVIADGGVIGGYNWYFEDVNISSDVTATSSYGIKLIAQNAGLGYGHINRATITTDGPASLQTAGIYVHGLVGGGVDEMGAWLEDIHVENHTDGVHFDTQSQGFAHGVVTSNGVVNAVEIDATRPVTIEQVRTTGGVCILDNPQSKTVPAFWCGFYASSGLSTAFSTFVQQLAFTKAASVIVPGATSLNVRNNANTFTNLQILDGGTTTVLSPATAGGIATFAITPGAHTAMTAEIHDFLITATTITLTGNYTNQRFAHLNQPTITAASAVGPTAAVTMEIVGAPTFAGSAVSTRVNALRIATVGPTLNNIAGTIYRAMEVASHTIVLANTTQMTDANAVAALTVGQVTINQTGGAVTVNKASSLHIQGPPIAGTSVTVTNLYAMYVQSGTISLADTVNIELASSGTGTKIGTGSTQLLGFYNATPIARRSGAAQTAVAVTGSTQTTPFGYTTAAQADAIVTLVNELRAWAVVQGFIKGSA